MKLDDVLRAKYRELMNPRPAAKDASTSSDRTAALKAKLSALDRKQWREVIDELNRGK